jgi:hypothetical protein
MKTINACDCECIDCGCKAVAFFPVCDPDIPSYPYCRKCLDNTKAKLYIQLLSSTKEVEK